MNIRLRSPAVSATVLYASTRAITAGDLWAGADVGVVASTSRALRSGAVPTTLAAAAKRARGCCNARLPNVAVALARATLACCPPLPPPLPVLPAAKEKNGLSPCLAPHRCAGTVVGVMGVGHFCCWLCNRERCCLVASDRRDRTCATKDDPRVALQRMLARVPTGWRRREATGASVTLRHTTCAARDKSGILLTHGVLEAARGKREEGGGEEGRREEGREGRGRKRENLYSIRQRQQQQQQQRLGFVRRKGVWAESAAATTAPQTRMIEG